MNDDQLKRELEEALSVEPSAHFTAQVRARIAHSRRPMSAWTRWGVAVAGFALVAVVAAFLHRAQNQPTKIAVEVEPKKTEAAPAVPAPRRPMAADRAAKKPPPKTNSAEVLIDPREVAAFQKFVEGVREDRIDIRKLIELQKAAATPAPIREIALMPIEGLEPIVIESLTLAPRRTEGESL